VERSCYDFPVTNRRTYSLRLDDRGRLLLPSELRRVLRVEPGAHFTAVLEDDGSVRLVAAWAAARRGRGLLRDRVRGGGSLVTELIAERRDEPRE
jgi:bifunctional DNA-binding transcriptional regulator/antitoxin component of YhaV-PrlF toxin-antitoxin module